MREGRRVIGIGGICSIGLVLRKWCIEQFAGLRDVLGTLAARE